MAIDMARFFGAWNRCQSRRPTKSSTRRFSSASVVVPIFGLNYVLTALLSQWFLGEPVHGLRWLGIALVVGGVALIARSVPNPGSL